MVVVWRWWLCEDGCCVEVVVVWLVVVRESFG